MRAGAARVISNPADVLPQLEALAEPAYRDFASRLIPGGMPMLGVRLPALRRLARELAAGAWQEYLDAGISEQWMEQVMLRGLLPAYLRRESYETRIRLVEAYVPSARNWSLCDSCCASYRFVRERLGETYERLQPLLNSREEYPARFGVVMLLQHYLQEPAWVPEIIQALLRQPAEGYYARMAVAWCCCELHLRYPERAAELLRDGGLPEESRRMAQRKIRESRRRP